MPRLVIDINNISRNAEKLNAYCSERGVELVAVAKACAGSAPLLEALIKARFKIIGWSRSADLPPQTGDGFQRMLLRQPPSGSDLEKAAKNADVVLLSTAKAIAELDRAAARQDRCIGVILMIETGDRREGFLVSEAAQGATLTENSGNLNLLGVGTNVACLTGFPPTTDSLNDLIAATEAIENNLGRELQIISGGNSSAWRLLSTGELPARINQLRFGEAILLGLETVQGEAISICLQDTIRFHAEVLEVRKKPERGSSEFRWQAVLAAGYSDFCDCTDLRPTGHGLEIVRASSDHLVVALASPDLTHEGAEVEFSPGYRALVALMRATDVVKEYI